MIRWGWNYSQERHGLVLILFAASALSRSAHIDVGGVVSPSASVWSKAESRPSASGPNRLNSVFRRKQRSWIQPRIQTNRSCRCRSQSVAQDDAIIVLLALILFVLWGFMEKRTPSTSRAQFQVYVVGIASEVTGRDIRVLRPAERVGCSAIRPTEPRPAPSPTASCWPAVPAASSVDVVAPRPYRIAQRAGDADIDDLFPFNFTQTATA